MPVVLVGRTHSQVGKRLWEIVGNLKNYGVGRMVVRTRDERYKEPTYYRILSARPEFDTGRQFMQEDNLKGAVLVDTVFRGRHLGVKDISKIAYKTDFRLIPKHEEYKYIEAAKAYPPTEMKILPQTMEMPPLLKIIAEREGHESTVLKVRARSTSTYRIAEDGETPTVELDLGLGTPACPELYGDLLENN